MLEADDGFEGDTCEWWEGDSQGREDIWYGKGVVIRFVQCIGGDRSESGEILSRHGEQALLCIC